MSFQRQLTAASNQCHHWASSPEPDAYYADVAVLVNAVSAQARREGAGHLAERWELCTPTHAMRLFDQLLGWFNKPSALVELPPGTPAWITPELVALTMRVWQPYYADAITAEVAITMVQNVGRLFGVLREKQ
jgi:hypothetical protein